MHRVKQLALLQGTYMQTSLSDIQAVPGSPKCKNPGYLRKAKGCYCDFWDLTATTVYTIMSSFSGIGMQTLLAYVNFGSSLSNLSWDKTAKGASHKALAASAMSKSSRIGLYMTKSAIQRCDQVLQPGGHAGM